MIRLKTIVVSVAVRCGFLLLLAPAVGPRGVHAQPAKGRDIAAGARNVRARSEIRLELAGTERAYFTHDGKPLLSFGGLSDFMFYLAEDAYDYRRWADWAAAHGVNHVRAYPPLSFTIIERVTLDNGGKKANMLFPYRQTSPGSRQFDLTQFDNAFWKRFRAQCEYLESKGIVIHLMMCSGFHIRSRSGWSGSFFNPANNVNAFTDHLPEGHLPKANPEAKYYVLEESKEQLTDAQKAWFYKVLEETHDLDNVYYDLVHEIGHHLPDWERLKPWIEAMALATRKRWTELEPNTPILLGMDAGSFEGMKNRLGNVGTPRPGSPIDWIFSRPYFDVLIYGRGHYVPNARRWRQKYRKPYIGQECWDESHRLKNRAGRTLGHAGYSYRASGDRVHIRKYLWKFMMAKCQQMDVYIKPLSDVPGRWGPEGYPHNYDPNGWSKFEDDALILRRFWDSLVDYPNLWYKGTVVSGPGSHQYVLSSPIEAVLYCSSKTRVEGERFDARVLSAADLALADGRYRAEIVRPAEGVVKTDTATARDRTVRVRLPAFTDDIAVHIYRR